MGTSAESPRRVKKVSRILDRIECSLKSRLSFRQKSRSSFRNSIFMPASRIFVKNAGPIIAQLSNNDASITDASRQFDVNEKSLKESMRYYLFRWGNRVIRNKRRRKLALRHNKENCWGLEGLSLFKGGAVYNPKNDDLLPSGPC